MAKRRRSRRRQSLRVSRSPGTDLPKADWSCAGERPATGYGEPEAGSGELREDRRNVYPSYSTVTLFARFRGLSTSQPRRTAMW